MNCDTSVNKVTSHGLVQFLAGAGICLFALHPDQPWKSLSILPNGSIPGAPFPQIKLPDHESNYSPESDSEIVIS
jgi:hypothetical protein